MRLVWSEQPDTAEAVATAWGDSRNPDANARLIAAAPDLLALVTEFEAAVSLNYGPNRDDTLRDLATRARSLLATVTP